MEQLREKVKNSDRLLRQELMNADKESQLRIVMEEKHSNAQRQLKDQVVVDDDDDALESRDGG